VKARGGAGGGAMTMRVGVGVALAVLLTGIGLVWWGVTDAHCRQLSSDVFTCSGTLLGLVVAVVGGALVGGALAGMAVGWFTRSRSVSGEGAP
jgi:hypothetical protein